MPGCSWRDWIARWLKHERMVAHLRCNNDFALKQFTLDGLGLALFPRFFVERELESGKLVQAIPDYPPP